MAELASFQLQLTQLVQFLRDVPPAPTPSPAPSELPPSTWTAGDAVMPMGIGYDTASKKLIVSLRRASDSGGTKSSCLKLVNALDGERQLFGGTLRFYRGLDWIEAKLAVVPAAASPGWAAGTVFVATAGPTGVGHVIALVAPDGSSFIEAWSEPDAAQVNPAGTGGLAFDVPGVMFGGGLLVIAANGAGPALSGKLYRIPSPAFPTTPVLIADLGPLGLNLGLRPGALAVAPATFGPYGFWAIIGMGGSPSSNTDGGAIWAVDSVGLKALVIDLRTNIASLAFVPAMGGTLHLAVADTARELRNRVVVASASQLMGRRGQLIATAEVTGEVFAISWDGVHYQKQVIGRVRPWTSEGFGAPRSLLKQCCIAELPPKAPTWTSYVEVGPTAFTTDQHPAVALQDPALSLLARADGLTAPFVAGQVYRNDFDVASATWGGFTSLSATITTLVAPAAAYQEDVLHAFVVNQTTGAVTWFRSGLAPEVIPGVTTALAPAAAVVNGSVIVCVKSNTDNKLYINELRATGQGFLGWALVPGGDVADVAPTVAAFQDELYVFFVSSQKVFARARAVSGEWGDKAEVPGSGSTDVAVGAAGTPSFFTDMAGPDKPSMPYFNGIYLFLKNRADSIQFYNQASETGTWSGWTAVDAGSTTDRPLAACVTTKSTPVVYLFARFATGKIHFCHTT